MTSPLIISLPLPSKNAKTLFCICAHSANNKLCSATRSTRRGWTECYYEPLKILLRKLQKLQPTCLTRGFHYFPQQHETKYFKNECAKIERAGNRNPRCPHPSCLILRVEPLWPAQLPKNICRCIIKDKIQMTKVL